MKVLCHQFKRNNRDVWVHATATNTKHGRSYYMMAHYRDSLEVTDLTASEAAKVAGCFNE